MNFQIPGENNLECKSRHPWGPHLSPDALGSCANKRVSPNDPLAHICMISKFLVTQPNILKQKINQTFYSALWRSEEETEKSKTLQPVSFVKESSSVMGLTAFPNSINWNLTEKQML